MAGYTLLDNLLAALTGNSALMALVSSKIYKNKAISASAVDINGVRHQKPDLLRAIEHERPDPFCRPNIHRGHQDQERDRRRRRG